MKRKSINNPKLAAAISLLLAVIFFMPVPLFAVDFVAGYNQDAGMQKTVFTAIDKVSLKPAPQLKADPNDVELPLGQPLTVTETKEEWLHVKTVNTGNNGWVHKSTIVETRKMLEDFKKAGTVPSNILYITRAEGKATFNVAIISGSMKISFNLKQAIPEEGNCIFFSKEAADKFRQTGGIDLKGLGVEGSIISPVPDSLYLYSKNDKQYRLVSERLAGANAANTSIAPVALKRVNTRKIR
jgi:hypothetical protein